MPRRLLLAGSLLLACGDSVAETSLGTSAGTTTGSGTTTTGSTGSTSTGIEPTTTGSSATGTTTGTSSSSGPDLTSSTSISSTTDTTGAVGTTTTTTTTSDSTSTSTSTSTGPDSSTGDDTSSSTGADTGSSTGAGAVPPNVGGQCTQGAFTQFVAPMPVAPELHIVGVYEPTAVSITVDITRTDIPLILVLSSYEPVDFILNLAPGVILEEVILNGYNTHTVQGQGPAPVTDRSGMNYFTACAYEWPGGMGGCETPELVAGVEAFTGLTLTSFAGCYQGSQFSLD